GGPDPLGIGHGKAIVDLGVAVLRPPEVLEFFLKRQEIGMHFRIALGCAHQYPNSTHRLEALGNSLARPHDRRAAEQRAELASSHVLPSNGGSHPTISLETPRWHN